MNKYIITKRIARYYRPLLVLTIILLLYFLCNYFALFTIPRLKTQDLFFKLKYKLTSRPQCVNDIVIVGIDDSDYYAHGEKWPWKRDEYAFLTAELNGYRPAVIGYALGFIGKSANTKTDDLLCDTFKDAGNVIVASYFGKDGRYIPPEQDICEAVLGYGFTNNPQDADGVIRETKLFQPHSLIDEIVDYSFDLKIAEVYRGASIRDIKVLLEPAKADKGSRFIEIPGNFAGTLRKIPVTENGAIPLNYTAKMADFTVLSFTETIKGRVPPEVFRDKIVLVGTIGDVFQETSFTPFGKMPGVGVAANSVLMLLEGNFIYRLPQWINIILLLIVGFIVSVITSRRSIYYGVLLFLIVFIGFAGISLLLVLYNMTWDFFSIPVVVFAIYLTNGMTNYARLLLQSLRIKRFVFTDILTGLPTRRYFLFKLESSLNDLKEDEPLSLVIFSIDNFQLIASEAGTERADQILKKTGEIIARCSRKTRGMDFIARYGELEFCSILHRTPDKGALVYANRIKKTLAAKVESTPPLVLSIGIADARDLEKRYVKLFVKCAETALARAAREGRERICVYNPETDRIAAAEYKEEKGISEADLSYITEEFAEKYKEMAILANKLRTAQEEVIRSEKISAVGKMAATIHHDLGKPILNLRSGLERIKAGMDKVDAKELATPKKFVVTAIDEARRLEDMLAGFKNLYRPAEKKVAAVSINSIIDEMLDFSSSQMVKSDIQLAKKLAPQLPLVLADDGELKQVLLNLIHNAIEAMPDGGELSVDTGLAKEREKMIAVCVRDTGCGISRENLNKIFDAFFTTKTKKGEKGAGLGLYASMEIIKKYGGTIQVESTEGQGTVFTVYLPYTVRS